MLYIESKSRLITGGIIQDENHFHLQRRNMNKNIAGVGQENNCVLISSTDVQGTVLVRS